MKVNIRCASLCLPLLMLLSLVLVACGGNQVQTLNVLIGYNSTYPTQQKQWMQQITSEFQQATGSTIAWDTYSSSSDEQTKLQTSVVTGSGPDVFDLGTTFIPSAQATQGFTTLTDQDWKLVDPWKIWWMFAEQMGGSILSQDLKTAHLNSPEAVQAIRFWFNWATTYKIVNPNSMAWKTGEATQAFAKRQNAQTGAFLQAEHNATPTPFTGTWSALELVLASVSSKLANEVATNSYEPSHIKPLLDQANQQLQDQLQAPQ